MTYRSMGVTRCWRGGSMPRCSTQYAFEPSARTAEPTSDPAAATTPSVSSMAPPNSSGRLMRSRRSQRDFHARSLGETILPAHDDRVALPHSFQDFGPQEIAHPHAHGRAVRAAVFDHPERAVGQRFGWAEQRPLVLGGHDVHLRA